MSNILTKIIDHKIGEIKQRKLNFPLDQFIDQLQPSGRSFYQALLSAKQQGRPGYILECKKASPSKGLIRSDFNLAEICDDYRDYASCISVLTDEQYFQGSFDYVKTVVSQVKQPVLCKDFFIDEYQVYLARFYGANAILLMLSVLSDREYRRLNELATKLNMSVLTEVSNSEEMARAIALAAQIIGINNRNLRDLSTNTQTTFDLVQLIPPEKRQHCLVISESGIYNHQQVQQLATVADGFLVGSSLMAQADIADACRRLIKGEHKICGLGKPADAEAAYQHGATYGGLIFYPPSPRGITMFQAQSVVVAAPLKYVGVFVNAALQEVAAIAAQLKLFAVQLHGDEDHHYIAQLKQQLPKGCQIWKAKAVKDQLPDFSEPVDRFVLDTYHQQLPGGSGLSFDWSLLTEIPPGKVIMIAGGIQQDNVDQALLYPAIGLDINSGVENSPGHKDPAKIAHILNRIIATQPTL